MGRAEPAKGTTWVSGGWYLASACGYSPRPERWDPTGHFPFQSQCCVWNGLCDSCYDYKTHLSINYQGILERKTRFFLTGPEGSLAHVRPHRKFSGTEYTWAWSSAFIGVEGLGFCSLLVNLFFILIKKIFFNVYFWETDRTWMGEGQREGFCSLLVNFIFYFN